MFIELLLSARHKNLKAHLFLLIHSFLLLLIILVYTCRSSDLCRSIGILFSFLAQAVAIVLINLRRVIVFSKILGLHALNPQLLHYLDWWHFLNLMLQPTVVQFNKYVVLTALSHFTDGCVSRVELKASKESLLQFMGPTAQRDVFSRRIGFAFQKAIVVIS